MGFAVTKAVDCGDGAIMDIANRRSFGDGGVEWIMRYGDPESARFDVARLLASYDYLLSDEISASEAARRLRLLRAARLANAGTPNPTTRREDGA